MRALGDLTRLRIMRLIATMELAVGELAHALGQSQPRVSRHVAILCDAGLAERRREGSWVLAAGYAPGGERTARAVARLLAAAEERGRWLCADLRRRPDGTSPPFGTRARKAPPNHLPGAMPEEWDRLRALLAPADAVERALVSTLLGAESLEKCSMLGAGTGRIAELLEPSADPDHRAPRESEMLRLAGARLQGLPSGRVELVQGDFTALPFAPANFRHGRVPSGAPLCDRARIRVGRGGEGVPRSGGRIAVVDLAAPRAGRNAARTHAHARLAPATSR